MSPNRAAESFDIHECYANSLQLLTAAIVQPRHGILYQHETEVALAGFVDRRARAVRKIAAAEGQRIDAQARQMRFERRLEERAPARLIDSPLARPELLHSTREQLRGIELRGGKLRRQLT